MKKIELVTVKTNTINRPVFLSPNNADFEIWLGNEPYVIVRGQIIFRDPEGKIMVSQIDNENQEYTVDDFMKLPEGAPFELLNGKLTHMPSPFTNHQDISMKLTLLLGVFIQQNDLGKLFAAPLDVRFDKKNICQPDLLFISKANLGIIKNHIEGTPDLVIEILSWGTKDKDFGEKKDIYGKFGVREYWIINPGEKSVEVFQNENQKLKSKQKLTEKSIVTSKAVSGFSFDIKDIF